MDFQTGNTDTNNDGSAPALGARRSARAPAGHTLTYKVIETGNPLVQSIQVGMPTTHKFCGLDGEEARGRRLQITTQAATPGATKCKVTISVLGPGGAAVAHVVNGQEMPVRSAGMPALLDRVLVLDRADKAGWCRQLKQMDSERAAGNRKAVRSLAAKQATQSRAASAVTPARAHAPRPVPAGGHVTYYMSCVKCQDGTWIRHTVFELKGPHWFVGAEGSAGGSGAFIDIHAMAGHVRPGHCKVTVTVAKCRGASEPDVTVTKDYLVPRASAMASAQVLSLLHGDPDAAAISAELADLEQS